MSLSARDLTIGYEGNIIVSKLNMEIKKGKVTAIIGPNGCGKSTILKTIARLHKASGGGVYLDGQDERTIPYVYTVVCYGFWAYFLRGTMGLPDLMLWVSLGAIVALVIVTVVNRWWKISAHLTGMGGLLGGVCSYAIYYSVLPSGLMAILMLAALVLMYARIYLGAHTALQVVCGMLVGLVSTFLPSMIMSYA